MLRVEGLQKGFTGTRAVADLNLEIADGEFFTLLGPSGCGKTTTLRCIGGLEKPDGGSIFLGDRCLVSVAAGTYVPPERREMGMVFQSYALWPHMTVAENVAYPLKLRRVPRSEIGKKVRDALQLVGLDGYQDRQAPHLSGGQQQRVALARALVFSPQVLLLDEPLSNLDALLREEMRRELKELQSRIDVTMIYVTHDQAEALSLSDRIAIMNHGLLQQVGTPQEVYERPATPFAQSFLGRTVSLAGTLSGLQNGHAEVRVDGAESHLLCLPNTPEHLPVDGPVAPGSKVTVVIRPERLKAWPDVPSAANVIPSMVRKAIFMGDHYECTVQVGSVERVVPFPPGECYSAGQTIYLEFPESSLTAWLN